MVRRLLAAATQADSTTLAFRYPYDFMVRQHPVHFLAARVRCPTPRTPLNRAGIPDAFFRQGWALQDTLPNLSLPQRRMELWTKLGSDACTPSFNLREDAKGTPLPLLIRNKKGNCG
jgi:hypothetical protein